MAKTASPRSNGFSPRRDSPRRHLAANPKTQLDLDKAFEALRVEDAEEQRLRDWQRRRQAENVETMDLALAKALEAAQEQARIQQEKTRQLAEATLRRHYEREQEERRRKAEEERLRQQREEEARAERERQIRAEQERQKRAAEERARADAERQRQEQERAAAAEQERRRKEAEAKQKEEERRRQEAAARETAAQARRQAEAEAQAQAQAQAQAVASAGADSPERVHQEYLQLYFKIKTWKNDFVQRMKDQAKEHKDPEIKGPINEARRGITAEVGKLSDDKDLNRQATAKIKKYITDFLNTPAKTVGTMVPVNDFLPPSLQLNDNNEAQISDQAAYVICILVQRVVNLFYKYAFGEPHRAESIGVMVSGVFAMPQLQFTRRNPSSSRQAKQSLFPILLAKYHRVCPALFGVTADHNTMAGKRKLGWAMYPAPDDNTPKGTLVTENEHFDRMKGLAVGYSSIALRNFSNASTISNPYPPTQFWENLAQIVNLPPEKITPTHVCVLRNMFGHRGISRFLLFFGAVGFAALKEAFVELPKKLPPVMQSDSFVRELTIYVEKLGIDEHMHLY